MSNQDDDFGERMRRIQSRKAEEGSMLDDDDEAGSDWSLLLDIGRPVLAFVVGAVALVAGRGISMNYFMDEHGNAISLGWGDGGTALVLLFAIGLMFGLRDKVSHGALAAGAAAAFIGEVYYIPAFPELMERIYNPEYVAYIIGSGH